VGREGDEQRHDQEHLAEELETHKVERDGHVRRAAPLVDRYSAFVWDPTRETWDDFPVPPVMGSVSQMDGHTVVCGRCRSDQPTEQPESRLLGDMRLFVLDAGSRDWVEWDIPDSLPAGVGHPSTRYTAVRIG